jgi:hypothetical protein
MMSKTAKNTGGVSVQEELLPLKSGVLAAVAMQPNHTSIRIGCINAGIMFHLNHMLYAVAGATQHT